MDYNLSDYRYVGSDEPSAKPFSPSKIVIKIGFLLLMFWIIAILFSLMTFPNILDFIRPILFWVLLLVSLFPIILTLVFRFSRSFVSTLLRDPNQQEVYIRLKSFLCDNECNYYFEVKGEDVNFFFKSCSVETGKTKVKELFDIHPKEDEGNKLSFKFKDIQGFLDRKQDDYKGTIVSKFNNIDKKAVKISDDSVYVELKYSDMDSNALSKIGKFLNDLGIDVAKVKFTVEFTKPKGNK